MSSGTNPSPARGGGTDRRSVGGVRAGVLFGGGVPTRPPLRSGHPPRSEEGLPGDFASM